MVKTLAKLEMAVGSSAILTGSLYIFGVFGQTESIVASWGLLAVALGGIIAFLGINKHKITDFLKMILSFILVLAQTPAIFLWFFFNDSGISDGTPTGDFVAHWVFATPHIVILVLGIVLIVSVFKRNVE